MTSGLRFYVSITDGRFVFVGGFPSFVHDKSVEASFAPDETEQAKEFVRKHGIEQMLKSGMLSQEDFNKIMASGPNYARFSVVERMKDLDLRQYSVGTSFNVGKLPIEKADYETLRAYLAAIKSNGPVAEALHIQEPFYATIEKIRQINSTVARNDVISTMVESGDVYRFGGRKIVSRKRYNMATPSERRTLHVDGERWDEKKYDVVSRIVAPQSVEDKRDALITYVARSRGDGGDSRSR